MNQIICIKLNYSNLNIMLFIIMGEHDNIAIVYAINY